MNGIKPPDAERMSVVDRAWLRMDSAQNLMVINGVLLFEKHVELAVIRQLVSERFLCYKRFSQRPVDRGSAHYWEGDSNFDLGYHVVEEKPMSDSPEVFTETDLKKQVGEFASEPLDCGRPLWRVHYYADVNGRSAVIVRIHHCYADGIALMKVFLDISDEAQADASHGEIKAGLSQGHRRLAENPLKNLWMLSLFGLDFFWQLLYSVLVPSDVRTAFKNKLSGEKQVTWTTPLPLDQVKNLSKSMGCTVNDVLLAVLSGALATYIKQSENRTLQRDLRAMVPVNIRPLHKANELGNKFGLVFLDLPVGVEQPVKRVWELHRRMNRLKRSAQALMSFSVLSVLGYLPQALQRVFLVFFSSKASTVMTNVPGPRNHVSWSGNRVERTLFWVPQSGDIGVGISILSYAGKVEFGLMCDTGMIGDPDALVVLVQSEFERLVSDAGVEAEKRGVKAA